MRGISTFCSLALVFAAAVGCAQTGGSTAVSGTVVDASKSGTAVTLASGESLTVRLAGNATTGYSWTCTNALAGVLVPAGAPDYEPTPVEPGVVGSGGTYVFRFRAVAPGTGNLQFAYARSWEKDVAPAQTASYAVTVR